MGNKPYTPERAYRTRTTADESAANRVPVMSASSSNLPRWSRTLLWYVAFLIVLPLWGYGLFAPNLWLALFGLPLAVLLIYYSIDTQRCPSCGKDVRAIGRTPSHCMHCGAAYDGGAAGVRPDD